jgi:hypothetical protein
MNGPIFTVGRASSPAPDLLVRLWTQPLHTGVWFHE